MGVAEIRQQVRVRDGEEADRGMTAIEDRLIFITAETRS